MIRTYLQGGVKACESIVIKKGEAERTRKDGCLIGGFIHPELNFTSFQKLRTS